MSLEEMMKEARTDTFQQYKDGQLWYRSSAGFDYPEPLTYKGAAAFHAQEYTMQMMR